MIAVHLLSSLWRFVFNRYRRFVITYFFGYIARRSLAKYGNLGSPCVFRIDKFTLLKRSFPGHCEAETMRWVSQRTSIPMPKVLDAWTMKKSGREAIVMEWINGRTLASAWPSLADRQKLHIAEQLRGYICELRLLSQPAKISGRICSLNGGPCDDPLLLGRNCGPFDSEHKLNEFLLSRLDPFYWEPSTRAEIDSIREQLTTDHHIVFTHSDLCPRNILIDDTNNIVAILDWEMAGWKPEQWEYLKTMWMGQYDEGWPAFVQQCFPVFEDQLRLHNQMCKIHGAPF